MELGFHICYGDWAGRHFIETEIAGDPMEIPEFLRRPTIPGSQVGAPSVVGDRHATIFLSMDVRRRHPPRVTTQEKTT